MLYTITFGCCLAAIALPLLSRFLKPIDPVADTDSYPAKLSSTDMIAYLTQAVCLDNSGRPNQVQPIDPDCIHSRPQLAADHATYRKNDWPDVTDPNAPPDGWQASDSVLQRYRQRDVIVQTFDFGNVGEKFGFFDKGTSVDGVVYNGADGGQALLLVDRWATIAMTQDGGNGIQWFIAGDCSATALNDRRFLGWVLFRDDVTDTEWHSARTRLNITRGPDQCPPRFNNAFTRYRQIRLDLPFRIIGPDNIVRDTKRLLDLVVSEHYGGMNAANADHLERFFFARNLGLVRWERWSNPNRAPSTESNQQAAHMRRSGRCPDLGMHELPDQSWELVDCRQWTTLVAPPFGWSVNDFGWKALKAFGSQDPG